MSEKIDDETLWNRSSASGSLKVCRLNHSHLKNDCQWEPPTTELTKEQGLTIPAGFLQPGKRIRIKPKAEE